MEDTRRQEQAAPVAGLPRLLAGVLAAVAAELRAFVVACASPPLYGLLAVMLLGFVLAVHLPLDYRIDVGVAEGYGGDLPHLRGFNTAEHDEHGTYRWTADKARIVIPGLGQRAVTLHLDFFPIGPEALEFGPEVINLWIDEQRVAALPVRRAGGQYAVRIPARLLPAGTLDVTIRTHTFIPAKADDPRALGTPLDQIRVTSAPIWFPVAPDWGAALMWLLAALLFWAVVVRALAAVPRARWWAAGALGFLLPWLVIAAIVDPARWAFGAQPALIACAMGYLLVLLLRPALAWLAPRLHIPLDARRLGWLLLIVVLAFGLRYGGRLYPNSMHGDIGFHTNRFNEVSRGHVFLLSRNRGVDFPYPPGPYVLLAPFAVLTPDPPYLLQLGAALLEGLSALLIYTLVARTAGACHAWKQRHLPAALRGPPPPHHMHTALLAAALYVFTAAGFMTTWWSFDTHIYTQFFTLLLLTTLTDFGLRSVTMSVPPAATVPAGSTGALARWSLVLFVLCALVYLGHFGFFINTVLLGGLALLILWLAGWRGAAWGRRMRWPLTLAGIGAGVAAFALFYSFFLPLFLQQASIAAEGGLTELADRAPVPRSRLWNVLWEAGFLRHFGFFPIVLAPVGVWLLARRGRPALVPAALMTGSFLVSTVFAILPFITLSTQSTRWLMFSAWAIAIGAALGTRRLWRVGYAGRVVVAAMAGFVLWNTFLLWLGPMLWRIRPPEPF